MSIKIARRSLLGGLSTALVVGFDPVGRTWVTSAFADSPSIAIPDLDGVLATDSATLGAAAEDFGHYVHRIPVAVLRPASVEDVVAAVRFCRRHGIPVAARGQGHSSGGQAQVQRGLVIDTSTLDAIEHIGERGATVQAGVTWKALLAKSVPMGLTPPVLTGFVGLSVGGTLSMGGIGPASFRSGAQVNNVFSLEVVTGEGDLVMCSRERRPDLFDAVLGGVGQYGVIVRARLPMVLAPPKARSYAIHYSDPGPFFEDLNALTLESKVDGVYGQIVLDGKGEWIYTINANKFFSPGAPPDDAVTLANLHFATTALDATDLDTFAFDTLVDALFAFFQSVGLLDIPHVWGDIFLPATKTEAFVKSSLADLTAADLGPTGFVLLFPVRNRFPRAPAFRLPSEERVFLFDVLTSGSPADSTYVTTQLAKARARFEKAREIGGTLYPIGSTPMSRADWIAQYGELYPILRRVKDVYDPAHIMTPGPGIF